MIRSPALFALSMFALAVGGLACGERHRSTAADVPDTDVRRLPPERKAVIPDVILQAADRGRALGADSARVQILVVGDLQCASCRRWFSEQWPDIRTRFVDRGNVRVTFVNYPLRIHAQAVNAANATMCAAAQGAYLPTLERVFAAEAIWSGAAAASVVLDSIAAASVTDAARLRECTGSGRLLRLIRSDIDWADSVQVGELPAFVVISVQGSRLVAASHLRAVLDSAMTPQAASAKP